MIRLSFSALLAFLFFSCTAQVPVSEIRFNKRQLVLLLDSARASRAITVDRTDRYFDLVTPVEMSIQMKKPLSDSLTRADWVPRYKAFLQTDVADFTAVESQFVERVIRDVYATCEKVAPGVLPDTLILIKTKGRHYGDGVYYTRENCIVIPADVLRTRSRPAFTSTMYHELFHVYSRLNPAKRKALYQLIGFESIGLPALRVPESLASRVLYNPDGVDFAQKITLQTDQGVIHAVPVIYASHAGYTPEKPEFFGYLEFNLFPVEKTAEGRWQLVTKEDGISSALKISNLPDFFRQIRDNTGYIIHPDEVLADNFAFLMQSKDNPVVIAKFSPSGKQLIAQIEKVLQEK